MKYNHIIKSTAEECLEELKSLVSQYKEANVIQVITPSDTYEYDPVTFDKFAQPKHFDKYGMLVETGKCYEI